MTIRKELCSVNHTVMTPDPRDLHKQDKRLSQICEIEFNAAVYLCRVCHKNDTDSA
jgi:hypothetical protein